MIVQARLDEQFISNTVYLHFQHLLRVLAHHASRRYSFPNTSSRSNSGLTCCLNQSHHGNIIRVIGRQGASPVFSLSTSHREIAHGAFLCHGEDLQHVSWIRPSNRGIVLRWPSTCISQSFQLSLKRRALSFASSFNVIWPRHFSVITYGQRLRRASQTHTSART